MALGGGGKGGRCLRLTTLPPACADCHAIRALQPFGTLRDCFVLKIANHKTLRFGDRIGLLSQAKKYHSWVQQAKRLADSETILS
jgi:hypothetical protein